MEDHEEEIRGKQVQWHKEVKEQVFADEEHILVKRITEKMGNMRKAWKDAKAMQERSGWGVTSEENEESINEVLERECSVIMLRLQPNQVLTCTKNHPHELGCELIILHVRLPAEKPTSWQIQMASQPTYY